MKLEVYKIQIETYTELYEATANEEEKKDLYSKRMDCVSRYIMLAGTDDIYSEELIKEGPIEFSNIMLTLNERDEVSQLNVLKSLLRSTP